MAGLASGADAAYIYEEHFNIRDLEVWAYEFTNQWKLNDYIHQWWMDVSELDVYLFVD